MQSDERFLPVAEPCLGGNELAYVTDCVRSGWVSSLGEYIARFEEGFAAFCGVRYGVAVSNGTVALHLALVVLDIGPGDEVVLPSLTFVATANAVRYTGAEPVFADSDPLTWGLDPVDVARKITPRTKAILPVHLYGHPVDLQPLQDLAGRHGLFLIEDAAEAHGARYRGRRVGSFGQLNTFSFYGNKIITTGEGGMLTSDDERLVERARFLRDHAMSPDNRYWHPEIGYNYRMTNLQAALGVAQLEQIETFIERKRQIARSYRELLAGIPGLELQGEADWASSVFWMFSVLVTDTFHGTRADLAAYLRSRGIDSRPFFHPLHVLPPYARGESLPAAERLASQGLNLPSGVTLTDRDLERVSRAIRAYAEGSR
jgi:perosamine synthetase